MSNNKESGRRGIPNTFDKLSQIKGAADAAQEKNTLQAIEAPVVSTQAVAAPVVSVRSVDAPIMSTQAVEAPVTSTQDISSIPNSTFLSNLQIKEKQKKTNQTYYLDKDIIQQISQIAVSKGTNPSALVNEILRKAIGG